MCIRDSCNLDWTFPKYNPNPEDLEMLHAIANAVKDNNADIGFGFDGDGDRVGVTVSYTHLRAHETVLDLVCRLLLEKKKLKR